MQSKKEQLLLYRIRQYGDPAAFGEIFRIYNSSIRRFLATKLPSSEVDDVHATVFLRLLNYVRVASVEHLSGLVYTIARGAIAGYYRERDAPQAQTSLDLTQDQEGDAGQGMRKTEAAAEIQLITKALEALEEQDRELVKMRHFEGLTSKEIAYRLGRTEGAVRVALHRALERLREKIGDRFPL